MRVILKNKIRLSFGGNTFDGHASARPAKMVYANAARASRDFSSILEFHKIKRV